MSAAQTDQEFRDTVYRDALAAGLAPDVAAYIAHQVGRAPTANEQQNMRMQAVYGAKLARRDDRDALAKIADLYGAASLVAEFRRSGMPLRDVIAMLGEATGAARSISAAGVRQVRVRLFAKGYFVGGHHVH